MESIIVKEYQSPVGVLLIGSFHNELCLCDWKYRKMRDSIDQRILKGLNAIYEEGNSDVIEKTILQLEEYFLKERTIFDLPIKFVGTDFQKRVWSELEKVPYGETVSYLTLAEKLNNIKAIRAVASANGTNAISIIVPCHRIIGSDGKLVGYAGGLEAKKKLLKLESKIQQGTLFSY